MGAKSQRGKLGRGYRIVMEIETEVRYRVDKVEEKENLLEQYEKKASLRQKDSYYSPPGKDFSEDMVHYLRVRESAENSFDLHIARSSEQTEEYETGIEDPEELHLILEKLGFEKYVEVVKHREVYDVDGFKVTLDRIEGLGYFIEIETTEEDPDVDKIAGIAEILGLNEESKVVGKGYPDMVIER
ncbi:Adenylate cyclase, class 2 (thermophilic) [Candidatus Nanohalococcus occultus]|uniref:Adenylate cyclase, class 2 (Thermophilic) n=2 Tax=Candidatus Nanohalococcus occultus TaxID=2978047 RepID=A0ABY8CIP2_9ARCH|nr:Adenylate cyclase, class 2 (thermophilic) [Candidatus Nanohaloarchaeota archaeon SVXNc]